MKTNKIKNIIGLMLTCATVINAAAPVQAAENVSDEQIKQDVIRVVQEMEQIMKGSYENAIQELADLCAGQYDYELSYESFTDQGLPFSNYDYEEFIAAYATIQQYCMNNGIDLGEGINQIDFVTMETEPCSMTEYIPEQLARYIETEPGIYIEDGVMYLTEPGEIYIYEETETGSNEYTITGKEFHDLESVETDYLNITLGTIDIDNVYNVFGLNREDFKDTETARLTKIQEVLGKSQLNQFTFINNGQGQSESDKEIIADALANAQTSNQQTLITIASSLIGRVPYEWGGKSEKAGFDDSWYIFDLSERQKGLDCSGYIQWVLRTAGFEGWEELRSTSNFLSSDLLYQINAQDLRPGDLGLFYPDSNSRTNHIGMYLGNGYWIHCSSTAGTVTISTNSKFSIFRRLGIFPQAQPVIPDESTEIDVSDYIKQESEVQQIIDDSEPDLYYTEEWVPETYSADDTELYLMAKIVMREAYGEGYNGWVAVAQVIKNRVMHAEFPDTVTAVVSERGQFSTYKSALKMSDSEVDISVLNVCKKVLDGELRIFDRDDVIGFQRSHRGDEHFNNWDKLTTLGNHSFYTR